MKNRKYLKIGAVVLLSVILLVTAVLTSYASNNAYGELKMLMREYRAERVEIDSMTLHMEMDITDNGENVLRFTGDIKTADDKKNKSGQFQVTKQGVENVFEVYSKNDTVLFHLNGSENWYQTTSAENCSYDEDQFSRRRGTEDMNDNQQLQESLMDAIMGDLKDQIALVESNGLRTFSLTLDKSNMPVLVQTLFSIAEFRDDTRHQDDAVMLNLPEELQDEIGGMMDCEDLAEITSNRVLEVINISLSVDEKNQPKNIDLSMRFSGTAKDGTAHVIEVDCSVALSNINTTVPDEVNVDPSSITIIETEQFENCR